jgi:hypothetical protein
VGKKRSITIGSFEFDRKGDALKFLKAILNQYNPGDRVNAEDTEVLRAALALLTRKNWMRHPKFQRPERRLRNKVFLGDPH